MNYEVKQIAKERLKEGGFKQLLHVLLMEVCAFGLPGMVMGLFITLMQKVFILGVVGYIFSFLLMLPFEYMLYKAFINISKGDGIVTVGDMFKCFNMSDMLKMFKSLLVVGLKPIIFSAIAGAVTAISPLIGGFLLLALSIYFVVFALTRWPAMYILLDNPDLSGAEVEDMCKAATKGHLFDVIWLGFSFIGWMFTMAIPFVGIFIYFGFVFPYIMISVYLKAMYLVENAGGASENRVASRKREESSGDRVERNSGNLESVGGVTRAEVNSLKDTMIACIRGTSAVDIVRKDGQVLRGLPIDIVNRNGGEVYQFMVQADGGVKPTQIYASDIQEIRDTGRKFNPATYINWETHWNIPRDWGV